MSSPEPAAGEHSVFGCNPTTPFLRRVCGGRTLARTCLGIRLPDSPSAFSKIHSVFVIAIFVPFLFASAAAEKLQITNAPTAATPLLECDPTEIKWVGGSPPYIALAVDHHEGVICSIRRLDWIIADMDYDEQADDGDVLSAQPASTLARAPSALHPQAAMLGKATPAITLRTPDMTGADAATRFRAMVERLALVEAALTARDEDLPPNYSPGLNIVDEG
ncbi:hypothetical protein FB45DRAFT_1059695 [Roridomyces roridus]|uniref:Uncharacterized protein n=1 Tax=Roridomyces roridus TaxID=1738132 RepID=A0AAD7BSR0_9AGAR|nr:hypothetical protein FB45DRAFT_1059695 [Roridomyces roridus]